MQEIELTLDNETALAQLGKALSSDVRIAILKLLCSGNKNINEIAESLSLPQSSAVSHVKVLEEAGLIKTELVPAIRGSMKVCRIDVKNIGVKLNTNFTQTSKMEVVSMPIGHFVDYQVLPTCGIVSEKAPIGEEDEPRCFFEPDRVQAQLIWLGCGYLEYRFPNHFLVGVKEKYLEISAEISSEDHEYNMDYPSDITLWVNGLEAGTFTCPSDFGGRRGKLNPKWWPDKNTQYGLLKTWKLTSTGTYIDDSLTNAMKIEDYKLFADPYITVRIGVKEDAKHRGGMNLFGECFGDHKQNIIMKIIYE